MDRRLIRTAVFGSPDSDEPALCPETPEELDAFWREHGDVTIWCGTKFEGGCGRQLMTRRCTDKICHFAHYRSVDSDHKCGRKERGKESADHLFTKAHLASWLRALGIAAEFTYPEPLGSAVAVRLEDGRTLLVHLDRNRPVACGNGAWETILGPGVRIAPDALAQRGYVHRVRFDDRPGGGRTMQFGTEIPGAGSKWGALDEVVLTSESLVTATKPAVIPGPTEVTQQPSSPAERAIVTVTPSRRRTAPAARQADLVRQALLRLEIALRDHPRRITATVGAIRQLLETDQEPDDAARLRLALGRGERWLAERARLRRAVVERLKERPTLELYKQAADLVKDPDASAEEKKAVATVEARARRAQEQERAAREREKAERHATEERERAERHEALERERAEMRERKVHQARVEKVEKYALAVRGALKKAAREGRTITWTQLKHKTGLYQLDRLDHQEKVELLVLVESNTASGAPLWSILLAAVGEAEGLRLHRDVSNRLSRTLPVSDAELVNQLTTERTELHRQW